MQDDAGKEEETIFKNFYAPPTSPMAKVPAARRPSGTPLRRERSMGMDSSTFDPQKAAPRRHSEPMVAAQQEQDDWASLYCGSDVNASKKLMPVRISKLAIRNSLKVGFGRNPNVTKPSKKYKNRRHSMPAIMEIAELEIPDSPEKTSHRKTLQPLTVSVSPDVEQNKSPISSPPTGITLPPINGFPMPKQLPDAHTILKVPSVSK